MTDDRSPDTRFETLRPAARAGLAYFSVVRPIAVAAGVTLPPDPELIARFAVTENIDLAALVADAAAFRATAAAAGDSTENAADVARRLSSVWSGSSADAAHDCIGRHVVRAEAAVAHVREVATATEAAASAISRVLVAKYLSVATIHTDLVAGRPMVELTDDDVTENRTVIAADISAKLLLFDRAVAVADSAVAEILTVLGASFDGRPTVPYPEPTGWNAVVHADTRRRGPAAAVATRIDIAPGSLATTTRRETPRRRSAGGAGERPRVGAAGGARESPSVTSHGATFVAPRSGAAASDSPVSMVAAIAEAAIASASAVGMAAAGGFGAALNMAIDAIMPAGDGDRSSMTSGLDVSSAPATGLGPNTAAPRTLILNLDMGSDHDMEPGHDVDRVSMHHPDDRTADRGDSTVVPIPTPTIPTPPAIPTPEPQTQQPDSHQHLPSPDDGRPAPPDSGEEAPAVATPPEDRADEAAATTPRQPSASPDPDDDGGLALARDR